MVLTFWSQFLGWDAPLGWMAFSTKIKGHHHLQGNVQVHNVRIPVLVSLETSAQKSNLKAPSPFRFLAALGSSRVHDCCGETFFQFLLIVDQPLEPLFFFGSPSTASQGFGFKPFLRPPPPPPPPAPFSAALVQALSTGRKRRPGFLGAEEPRCVGSGDLWLGMNCQGTQSWLSGLVVWGLEPLFLVEGELPVSTRPPTHQSKAPIREKWTFGGIFAWRLVGMGWMSFGQATWGTGRTSTRAAASAAPAAVSAAAPGAIA